MVNIKLTKKSGKLLTALIISAVCLIAIAVYMSASKERYMYVTELQRPETGRAEKEYDLDVLYDGSTQRIEAYIGEKTLDGGELDRLYEEAEAALQRIVLNGNDDFNNVEIQLKLADKLPDYNMSINWYIEDWNIIDYMGQVYQDVSERTTYLVAELTYEGKVKDGTDVIREYSYTVTVPAYTEEQLKRLALTELIAAADEKYKAEDKVLLPGEYAGSRILYKVKRDNDYAVLILLFPVILILIIAKGYLNKRNKEKKKEEFLVCEYPEVISKLSLLTGAGMTPYNALCRIASDGKGEAYGRLSEVVRRIQSGSSERELYSQFGQIFGVRSYSKLGTLLSQNVVRGNEQLRDMLRNECIDAFEEKKARARKKGEQAGTKLLFPMLLMLLVVMAIIMVPAFMSF